jgi:hypothetical protein
MKEMYMVGDRETQWAVLVLGEVLSASPALEKPE